MQSCVSFSLLYLYPPDPKEATGLLDQVAADDRGNVLTKTYLTSDTGKVYTMLAHASGRLN